MGDRRSHGPVRRQAGVIIAVCVVMAVLYTLSVSYNLNYFYLRGAAVYDVGWFAWLANHGNHWPLPNPPLIGGNFLAVHVSPVFFLTSAATALVPFMPDPVRFSLVFSVWLPLLWIGIFQLLGAFEILSVNARIAVATLLTLNGLALSMFGFPHIESFIPPLLLLALALLLRPVIPAGLFFAGALFLAMLSIREDAGLHACLALGALLLAKRHQPRDTVVALTAFALAGALYSASALAFQAHLIPDGGRSLGNIYVGRPPLAQVTLPAIIHRVLYWASARSYIFVPIGILTAAGLWFRDWSLLLGILIALPWLLLSLIAVSPMAGDLWGYYSFPLMVSCLWPLLLAQLSSVSIPTRMRFFHVQLAMGCGSTVMFVLLGVLPHIVQGGAHDRAPWTHLAPPSISEIVRTEAALTDLHGTSNFNGAIFDDGVASLMLGSLHGGQYRYGLDFDATDLVHATTFVRFDRPLAYVAAQEATITQRFPVCLPIQGTAMESCTTGER